MATVVVVGETALGGDLAPAGGVAVVRSSRSRVDGGTGVARRQARWLGIVGWGAGNSSSCVRAARGCIALFLLWVPDFCALSCNVRGRLIGERTFLSRFLAVEIGDVWAWFGSNQFVATAVPGFFPDVLRPEILWTVCFFWAEARRPNGPHTHAERIRWIGGSATVSRRVRLILVRAAGWSSA